MDETIVDETVRDSLRIAYLRWGGGDNGFGAASRARRLPFAVIAEPLAGSYVARLPGTGAIACPTGCVLVIPPELPHDLDRLPDGRGAMRLRYVGIAATCGGGDVWGLLAPPPCVRGVQAAPLRALLAAFASLPGGEIEPATALRVQALGCALIAELAVLAAPPAATLAAWRRGAAMRTLLAEVQRRLAERWDLRRMAALASCSPSRLQQRFRAQLGTSPKAWLIDARVAEARRCLTWGDAPVTEIAAACGFADPFHFSRIFRARTGISPRAWRDRARREGPG